MNNTPPPAGGFNPKQAVNLGGPTGDGNIDLTKPITDQDFRAGTLALLAGINDSLGILAFHLERGMPAVVNQLALAARAQQATVKVFESLGVIEIPDATPVDEQPRQVPVKDA